MKNIQKFAILIFTLLAVTVLATPTLSQADFGHHSGRSSYGGSHRSSSSSRSSRSSSSRSSSSRSSSSRSSRSSSSSSRSSSRSYSSGSSSRSSSSSGSSKASAAESIGGFLAMFIFGNIGLLFTLLPALVIFFVIKKTMQNRGNTSRPAGASRATNLRPIAEYKTLDPEFDEAELASKISNLYVQLQDAWQAKNLETIRPYLTDAFYNMSDRQVQEMKAEGVTNYVDRIAVLGTDIRGFYQTSGMDHIVVELRTRIVDYTLNDATGELVDGDRNMEKFMTYEWDVCRKTGVKTKGAMATAQSISCPHCGAALNINQTAKCPYCDSIVTIDNEDWALCNIKGISQRNGE